MYPINLKSTKSQQYLIMIFAMSLVLSNICVSQTITFQKTIAGPSIEYFRSVIQTPDNGYIAAGTTNYGYLYIVRFDMYGDTIWTKQVNRDDAYCLIKTIDNNYVTCGGTGSFVKFDLNGNILINKPPLNGNFFTESILQLPDGRFFMCGADQSGPEHPYVVMLSPTGSVLWDSLYTEGIYSGFFWDAIVSGNSIVLTGYYSPTSPLTQNIFIMKIDFDGHKIFFNSGFSELYVWPRSIVESPSGKFIICGGFRDNEAFLAKYGSDGTFEWIKAYDTNFYGIPRSITLDPEGNYVYTGYVDSSETQQFVRIRKTDTNGVEIWKQKYGFQSNDQLSFDIKLTSDSGFVVVGYTAITQEDWYLLKTDKNGNLLPPIGIEPINGIIPQKFNLSQNYPNPFNPETSIKFDIPHSVGNGSDRPVRLLIYDVIGNEIAVVVNQKLSAGSYEVKFDGANLASGMYFYSLEVGSFKETKKMVLLK